MVRFRWIPIVILILAPALCCAQSYTITTVAGGGNTGAEGNTIGDGGPSSAAALSLPGQIALGAGGAVYFVDNQTVIRMLTPAPQ